MDPVNLLVQGLQNRSSVYRCQRWRLEGRSGAQWLGKAASFLLPVIAVLSVAIGFFASSTYDSGSTAYLRQCAAAPLRVAPL